MTTLGRTLLAVGTVGWVFGAILGWTELLVVAAACLVAVAASGLFTFGRTQLEIVTKLHPTRVVAGDRAVAEFNVTNAARRPMLPLRLEVPIGQSVGVLDVPTLGAGATFEEVIVIPTSRRSVVTIGPTRSVRGDPLGLMRREVTWTEKQELFVHPSHTRLEGVTAGWLRDLEGRPTTDRSPSDLAFHTLREYVPGDDQRHVHWRSSAKLGKLMVRQFIDTRRSHLALVVDTNPAHFDDSDEFELAISMAASLGLRAIIDGQETSCVGGSHLIAGHTGQALLDGLCRVDLGVPGGTIRDLAIRAAPFLAGASVVAVVTGSSAPLADVQAATHRFGAEAQMLCVQATRRSAAAMRDRTGFLALSADSLDSFARVMTTLASR